jgi:hypothetical protein
MQLFKDWRECDISEDPGLILDKTKSYYLHAKAWHFKGYIGGTHSWFACYNTQHKNWLVAEVTDQETLDVQQCRTIYSGAKDITNIEERAAFISDRLYNGQWFGNKVHVVDSCPAVDYSDLLYSVKKYPIEKFELLNYNCNTFLSYLIWDLQLDLKRPIRSVGFKNTQWWNRHYEFEI